MDKQLHEIEGRITEELPLPKDLKQRWIAALRSGQYRQCRGHLKRVRRTLLGNERVKHCALGVLHEVAGSRWVLTQDGFLAPSAGRQMAVHQALNGATVGVWIWNDCDGLSFAEIADKLETL